MISCPRPLMFAPIGQVVVISVRNIGEPAFLRGKIDRVDRAAARVPAFWPLAGGDGVELDGLVDLGPLGLGGHVLVFDPFEPVAGDLPAGLLHGLDLGRCPHQRRRHAIDRHRDLGLGEQAMEPPESGAGAVFIDRFHVPMALARPLRRPDDFGQEGLGRRVPVQHAIFPAFLVIEDETGRRYGRLPAISGRGFSRHSHACCGDIGSWLCSLQIDRWIHAARSTCQKVRSISAQSAGGSMKTEGKAVFNSLRQASATSRLFLLCVGPGANVAIVDP